MDVAGSEALLVSIEELGASELTTHVPADVVLECSASAWMKFHEKFQVDY